MEDHELIAVSPRHSVRLELEYVMMVRKAPRRDFVVRTIAHREANGLQLMSADIVIAGDETREKFPAAKEYPLHFRKTYYPGRLHGEPKHEYDLHAAASAVIGIPAPIGYTHHEFRSCLLPGAPYDKLSPFTAASEEQNVKKARELHLAHAAGLWHLVEEAFGYFTKLHENGLAHGDAELHNLIVCTSPLEVVLIDFEAAVKRGEDADAWDAVMKKDLEPLLREVVLLQCCLGQQPGPMAELAWERIDTLFKQPDRVRTEIDRRTTQPA
jgi:hypothetical protein